MSNGTTKAVNLTEDEVKTLVEHHGYNMSSQVIPLPDRIERINYLHKRLKAFSEPEKVEPETPRPEAAEASTVASGWGVS